MKLPFFLLFLLQGVMIPNLSWEPRSPLPIPAAGGYLATISGKVVYVGGSTWQNGVKRYLSETHIYDPATDRWSSGPKLPAPLAYGAFLHTPRGLEILGGTDGDRSFRDCWLLDSVSGNWKKCQGDPGDTLLATSQPIGAEAIVFGGCPNLTELARCTSSVRLRDASGRWTSISKLPHGSVSNAASAALNGSVFLFGGVSGTADGSIENRAEAFRFQVKEKTWKRLRPLPRAARGLTAVTWDARYIVLAGGYVATQAEAAGKPTDFGFSSDVYVYDTTTDEYHRSGSLPLACAGLAMVRAGDAIVAIGGEERMRSRTAQVLVGRTPSSASRPPGRLSQ